MTWQTTDNIALCKHLASEGKSGQFIAWQMGTGVSRSAVIGFCSRNGIVLHGKPGYVASKSQAKKKPPWPRPRQRRKSPQPIPDPTLLDPKFNSTEWISLLDAMPYHCRWPLSAPRELRCCGKAVAFVGSVYCRLHRSIAYQ